MNTKGEGSTPQLTTHCRRETFHEALSLVFDREFVDAYKNGVVLKFPDGIRRRCYIRLTTYSADYPEKYVSIVIFHAKSSYICVQES